MGRVPELIQRFSPDFHCLEDYLKMHLSPETQSSLLISTFSNPGFSHFLHTTYILDNLSVSTPPTIQNCSFRDLLDVAIYFHLDRARFEPQLVNVVCRGYRHRLHAQPASNLKQIAMSIENYYPNTLLNQFLLPDTWDRLLSVVGNHAVLYLLLNTTIIVKLEGNKGLLQISGVPLTDSKTDSKKTPNPLNFVFSRHRIFYSEPTRSTLKAPKIGLPCQNPMNRYGASSKLDRLTEIIFYRNCTITRSTKKSASWCDFREFCRVLVKRHKKCAYNALYQYHCPDDGAPLLKDLAFDSQGEECNDQIHSYSTALPLSQWPLGTWESQQPHRRVFAFIRAVLLRLLFPWPTRASSKFMREIRTFISLRRFETMPVSEIMRGLSTLDFWSALLLRGEKKCSSPEEHSLRTLRIVSFVSWLMEDFTIPLIQSSAHRNRVFYFRKDTWMKLTFNSWMRVKEVLLEPAKGHQQESNNFKFQGFCRVRMLPKENGFRPIMNMRRPIAQNHSGIKVSINSRLRDLCAILDYHRFHSPKKLGSSAISLTEIYQRIKAYKGRFAGVLPTRFYFVKFDVKDCFDSIPHDLLLSVIHDVLSTEEFVIRRYSLSRWTDNQIKTFYYRIATAVGALKPVQEILRKGKVPCYGGLIEDKVVGQKYNHRKLSKQLEDHIKQNYVKVGGLLYRQKVGISQGSIVSTLLCSFFYGHLDQNHFQRFLDDPNSLFIRFIDDIIFVSPCRATVDNFVEAVSRGYPEYGFSVNMSKASATYQSSIALIPQNFSESFSWCGLLINTQTLYVTSDYSKFFGFRINDSLTLDQFERFRYLRPKLHPIYLDAELNDDWQVIAQNIYQNAIHVAIKCHVCVKEMERDGIATFSSRKVIAMPEIVQSLVQYAEKKIQESCKNPLVQKTALVKSLFYRAFLEMWEKRPTRYRPDPLFALEQLSKSVPLAECFGREVERKVLASGEILLENFLF